MSVTSGATLVGGYGMSAVIDDNNAIYVTDDSPNGETHYRARFYFDPNSISMASGDTHSLLYGYKGTFFSSVQVELRYSSGNYQVRALANTDLIIFTSSTSWYTISDAEHYIEIEWKAATGAGANNGELTLWIDGVQKQQVNGIDNDTMVVDRVRLGAVSGVDSGTRGTYYFDAFESRSEGYIGQAATLPVYKLAKLLPKDTSSNSAGRVMMAHYPQPKYLKQLLKAYGYTDLLAAMQLTIPEGQVWKTYYYAGSQRVAMLVQDDVGTDQLYYLFSDHLGSTSVVADSNGGLVSEQLYYPWGETRYSSGSPPTHYQYTGQYSHESDFGLYYYVARWYDPSLGRFGQADTIIPDPGNPIGWDRYSYVRNNPVNYTDPSGHFCVGSGNNQFCSNDDDMSFVPPLAAKKKKLNRLKNRAKIKYGITLSDNGKDWDLKNAQLANDSLDDVNSVLGGQLQSFLGGGVWTLGKFEPEEPGEEYSGEARGTNVKFFTMDSQALRQMNIYHELSHNLNSTPDLNDCFSNELSSYEDRSFIGKNGYIVDTALKEKEVYDPYHGDTIAKQASAGTDLEAWADILPNYVAGNIKLNNPQGLAMDKFITGVLIEYFWDHGHIGYR